MSDKKLVVIGGGAAGFFCAVNAAANNRDLKVIIVEKSGKILSKVKVSGGGRCNVTHACSSIAEMIKAYPRGATFLKKAFHHFFTSDTIKWFEDRGAKLKTEADGRMFPVTDSSETIINTLIKEANKYGVEIILNREVRSVEESGDKVRLVFSNDELIADYVCIASGGFAKLSQFDWLKKLGHTIDEPVPSLFTFNIPEDPIKKLMGISVEDVQVKIMGTKFNQEGPLLITHWGMSGPAVLKLSSFASRELAEKNYDFKIFVNWLGDENEQQLVKKMQSLRFQLASQKIVNRNPFSLPGRLWEYLLAKCTIKEDIRWADLPAKQQNLLVKTLCAQEFHVKGKTTFKEEFVTAGGIELSEIDVNTMESKITPNVYFAGEIMNVDGITGGFNFQHAWTSGWIAAQAIAKRAAS
jgi:predicted Rossmann fold flavoprotein